jgi:hypothetical protein
MSSTRWNKIVREETAELLSRLYSLENKGKGTRISIQKYLNKREETYGIVENIIRKNEKYEVFFRTITVKTGYKNVDGYYRQSGSGPEIWTTRELRTEYLWDETSDTIYSIKNPRILKLEIC